MNNITELKHTCTLNTHSRGSGLRDGGGSQSARFGNYSFAVTIPSGGDFAIDLFNISLQKKIAKIQPDESSKEDFGRPLCCRIFDCDKWFAKRENGDRSFSVMASCTGGKTSKERIFVFDVLLKPTFDAVEKWSLNEECEEKKFGSTVDNWIYLFTPFTHAVTERRCVAAVIYDGTVRIWDAEPGGKYQEIFSENPKKMQGLEESYGTLYQIDVVSTREKTILAVAGYGVPLLLFMKHAPLSSAPILAGESESESSSSATASTSAEATPNAVVEKTDGFLELFKAERVATKKSEEETEEQVAERLKTWKGLCLRAVFSPDGKVLVSCGSNRARVIVVECDNCSWSKESTRVRGEIEQNESNKGNLASVAVVPRLGCHYGVASTQDDHGVFVFDYAAMVATTKVFGVGCSAFCLVMTCDFKVVCEGAKFRKKVVKEEKSDQDEDESEEEKKKKKEEEGEALLVLTADPFVRKMDVFLVAEKGKGPIPEVMRGEYVTMRTIAKMV